MRKEALTIEWFTKHTKELRHEDCSAGWPWLTSAPRLLQQKKHSCTAWTAVHTHSQICSKSGNARHIQSASLILTNNTTTNNWVSDISSVKTRRALYMDWQTITVWQHLSRGREVRRKKRQYWRNYVVLTSVQRHRDVDTQLPHDSTRFCSSGESRSNTKLL